jgi:TRAP transporter TAXI family solute receptor
MITPMIRRRAVLLSSPAIVAALRCPAAQSGRVSLGTAGAGGGFTVYGVAFVDMMKTVDPTLDFHLVATRGTMENVPKLEAGELDLGLVSGEVAHEILTGFGRQRSNLKVITATYAMPGMFAVRSDSRFRTISDLKGHPVVWAGRDSGLAVQARYVLSGLDLDLERDFEAVYADNLLEAPEMVIDGRCSALWGSGLRWPGFVKIASSVRGARFVPPTMEEIGRIRARHPFLKQLTVQAGLYRGQYNEIDTVGSWSVMMARADLDDVLGRRLAASLHKAERTGQLTKQLVETTAASTLAAVPKSDMLQPGVVQYYREAGLLR